MPISTTNGPVEVSPVGHRINTSRIVGEDLTYLDEGPEILAVLPATGWQALIKDEEAHALVAFVALDSGKMHGVTVGEDGRIDLTDSVEDRPGFVRYKQANNNDKENQ